MLLKRTLAPVGSWRGPFSQMEQLRRDMERFLGSYGETPGTAEANVFPPLNVSEDKEAFRVYAELPGIKPEDIEVSVTGKTLTLSGERRFEDPGQAVRHHRRERKFQRFSRVVGLPSDVDHAKVEASSRNGVLTIYLPKSEAAKPRQIAVKTA